MKKALLILAGLMIFMFIALLVWGNIDTEQEDHYLLDPNLETQPYKELVDSLSEKGVYKLRYHSGLIEVDGIDIDLEKKSLC